MMCIKIPMLFLVNKIPECVMIDVSDQACNLNNNFVLNIGINHPEKNINACFVLQTPAGKNPILLVTLNTTKIVQ